ncbi:MAG: hypothetical protein ACJA1F_002794 [Paracoccaceae bacterium]
MLVANRFERTDQTKFFSPYDMAAQSWTALDTPPLYRVPELLAADADRVVIATQG